MLYVFSCNQTSQLLRTYKVSTRGRQINPFGLPSSRFILKFVGPQDPTRPSNFSCHKFWKMTFTIFFSSSSGRPIGFRKKLPPVTNVVPLQFPRPESSTGMSSMPDGWIWVMKDKWLTHLPIRNRTLLNSRIRLNLSLGNCIHIICLLLSFGKHKLC